MLKNFRLNSAMRRGETKQFRDFHEAIKSIAVPLGPWFVVARACNWRIEMKHLKIYCTCSFKVYSEVVGLPPLPFSETLSQRVLGLPQHLCISRSFSKSTI